jgi:hypothetical protein
MMDKMDEYTNECESKAGMLAYHSKLVDMVKERLTFEIFTDKCVTMAEADTKDKCFEIWLYEIYTDQPQNKLCAMMGVSSRHYRDIRVVNEDTWEERQFADKTCIVSSISEELTKIQDMGEYRIKEVYEDLKVLNFVRAEDWFNGIEVPEIESFLLDVWIAAGEYNDVFSKWSKCHPLRYFVTLSHDEQVRLNRG